MHIGGCGACDSHVTSQELASVKEENERLRHVRSNMDNEIHELTENLFEVCIIM